MSLIKVIPSASCHKRNNHNRDAKKNTEDRRKNLRPEENLRYGMPTEMKMEKDREDWVWQNKKQDNNKDAQSNQEFLEVYFTHNLHLK